MSQSKSPSSVNWDSWLTKYEIELVNHDGQSAGPHLVWAPRHRGWAGECVGGYTTERQGPRCRTHIALRCPIRAPESPPTPSRHYPGAVAMFRQ